MGDDVPSFTTKEEELAYWKNLASERLEEIEELEDSYNELKDSATSLEKGLETQISQKELQLQKLTRHFSLLQQKYEEQVSEHQKKFSSLTLANDNLEKQMNTETKERDQLMIIKRKLEQDNDDLLRLEREQSTTIIDHNKKLEKLGIEANSIRNEIEKRKRDNQMVMSALNQEISVQKSALSKKEATILRLKGESLNPGNKVATELDEKTDSKNEVMLQNLLKTNERETIKPEDILGQMMDLVHKMESKYIINSMEVPGS